jgi:hypothetical protein
VITWEEYVQEAFGLESADSLHDRKLLDEDHRYAAEVSICLL